MTRQAPRCPRCARSARSAAGPSRAVAEPPQKTHIYAPCSQVWRPEVQNRGVHRAALPLEALGEGPSCPFQPLGAAGLPWPVATHFSPCLSACPPACLSVSLCVCRNDTSLDAGPSGTIQGGLVSRSEASLHLQRLLPNPARFGRVSRMCREGAFLHLSRAPGKAVTMVSPPFGWRTES